MKKMILLILVLVACDDATNNATTNNGTTNNGTTNNETTNGTTNNGTTNNGTTNNGTTSNNGTTVAIDYSALVINEVAASGDPDDWFEIHNSGDKEIDLTEVWYSDDLEDTAKAQLNGIIQPNAYLMILASNETAGFKLGGDELVGIFAPDGTTIDVVDWDEGDSPSGKSFGRFPNGTGAFKTLNDPTPGAANIDNDPNASVCNDGEKAADEVCDQSEFGDKTCISEGFASGTLTCAADCLSVETTNCVAATNNITINEVNSSGDDQIELYNISATPIDIAGWYVVDDGYASAADIDHRYDFPIDTIIPAGGFLVLTKDVEHTFGIGGDDAITLYDSADAVIDQVTWPDGDATVSWCRATDGVGDFQICATASFGAINTP